VRHWTSRGADGWRLDAVQEVPTKWWRDFRTTVKSYAPDAPLIAEDTAGPVDASPHLVGTEFDGVMNYRFRQAALGFARSTAFTDSSGTIRPLTGTQLDHSVKAILADYPRAASAVSFNLVDSHDTNRVRFVLNEDADFEISRAPTARCAAAIYVVRRADGLLQGRDRLLLGGEERLRGSIQPRHLPVG
jgi:cyclomaltodextrinase